MRETIPHKGWWQLPTGPTNTICDISGVQVGHESIHEARSCTGVTAILPHAGDLYRRPVPAAASILNGFGKSIGLIQLIELGEIETPILLTNTFSVPVCATALIKRAIEQNPKIGRRSATVNPLVLECNDGQVNDIQALRVTEATAETAIANAEARFDQGTVGAGSGMKTFGFAGGIGSASRQVRLPGNSVYSVGALVLSNFGQQADLRVLGRLFPDRPRADPDDEDMGSIIIVLATDAPMDSRQLGRLSRRGGAALGRLGSYLGHQSGDIALAFSTANVFERESADTYAALRLCESRMNAFFKAVVESTEEAILNALWHATPLPSYDGGLLPSFRTHLTLMADAPTTPGRHCRDGRISGPRSCRSSET